MFILKIMNIYLMMTMQLIYRIVIKIFCVDFTLLLEINTYTGGIKLLKSVKIQGLTL